MGGAAGRGLPRDELAALAVVSIIIIATLAAGIRGMAIVEGRSMEPLFHTGDVVFLTKKPPEEIKVGDIIVYTTPDGRYIIHRVIDVYKVDDTFCYVVKGDNNPVPDMGFSPCKPYHGVIGVPYESIRGVVAEFLGVPVKVPYVGGLTLLVRG